MITCMTSCKVFRLSELFRIHISNANNNTLSNVVHVWVYVAVFPTVWQTLQHLNSSLDLALNWQLAPVSTNWYKYIIAYLILITTVYLKLHWHTNKMSQFYVISPKMMGLRGQQQYGIMTHTHSFMIIWSFKATLSKSHFSVFVMGLIIQ